MSNTIARIQDWLYPFKVWLATVIGGAIIFTLYDFLHGYDSESFRLLLILIPVNIILSLPGLLVYFLTFRRLNTSDLSIISMKCILILVAFSLVLFTWFAFNNLFGRDVFFSETSIFIYLDFLACITVIFMFSV